MRSIILALGFVLSSAGPALAQAVKNGRVSGVAVSASGSALVGAPDDLLTTPAAGAFVLTQICTAGEPGAGNQINLHVAGSTLGRIAQSYGDAALGSCTTFEPGMAIPPGETLSCVQGGNSSSPGFCTITGIQSKK